MADSGIEVTGLAERIKQLGEASTKNPLMRKRINEVIRRVLAIVRKNLQNDARSGLGMKEDPRNAYKAIRMAVYRRIFGGQVNILNGKNRNTYSGGYYYEPPRTGTKDPYGRGGNRRPQSKRTKDVMSYEGPDRGFILRFLNQGTKERNIQHLVEIKRPSGGSKFKLSSDGGRYGKRGSITARNWFGPASLRELEDAAHSVESYINDIIEEFL